MNKQELFKLANTGKVNISGVDVKIIIRPDCIDGSPFIEIEADPLSPLHEPLKLGGKWWEYVTDEECAELPAMLEKYKAEADEFYNLAQRTIKAHYTKEGKFKIDEVPEEIKAEYKYFPASLRRLQNEPHEKHYIKDRPGEWYALGTFTIDIDGDIYKPHWSYWIDRAYYSDKEAKQQKR